MASPDSPQDQAKLNEQLKSIVYGDVVKNKYGAFRCFCATISEETQIDNVIGYLRRNVSFHRLNKFSYSYRIATYERMSENYKNDARLEGCGEKILHLLQKFNVENVLLVIGVDKKETFGILSSEYYHTIIERAKDLLSTLYEKVLENDFGVAKEPFITSLQENMISTNNILRKAASVTLMDSNMIPLPQISRKLERPNHFMTAEQRQKIQSSRGKLPVINNDREKLLQSVLKNNLRRNFEKLRALLDDWQDNDYQHMKFICLYDKMPRISKVFKILMLLDDIRSPEELSQSYNFKDRLPQLGNRLLTKAKCKLVSEILRQDKLLTPKALARENPVVASLLEYVVILVRNFELSERIFALTANKDQAVDKDSYDLQYSKIAFDIEEERNNLVLDLTKDLAYTLKDTQKGSYEGAHVATTESDQQLLPRAQSNMELKNKLLLQKDSSKNSHGSSQRSTPRKEGVFVAKGMASGNNSQSRKVDKMESGSLSLSEENSHHMEPRFFGNANVSKNSKAESAYDPKVPGHRLSKNKSHDVMPKKSISKPSGVGNENMVMETNKYLSNALKPPGSGSKPSNGKINSNSRTTPQESMSNQALRGFSSELPESTEGNIPDDPEDIRKYLEKIPIDEQPDQHLEEIANKLENHRANI